MPSPNPPQPPPLSPPHLVSKIPVRHFCSLKISLQLFRRCRPTSRGSSNCGRMCPTTWKSAGRLSGWDNFAGVWLAEYILDLFCHCNKKIKPSMTSLCWWLRNHAMVMKSMQGIWIVNYIEFEKVYSEGYAIVDCLKVSNSCSPLGMRQINFIDDETLAIMVMLPK